MRLAGIILACTMSAMTSLPVQAAQLLSPAESIICKSVRHCVDIVERHAPDEYDYAALHGEFLRFGDKGKAALLKLLSGKDILDMQRAQDILSKGRFRFTPDEQRKVAMLWPRGNLDTHAKIMLGSLSPLMRARAIETLNAQDETVGKLSRNIVDAAVEAEMDFPLKPSDFGALARAAINNPTPGIINLLSTYGPIKTDPIFTRILQSGDGPSTIVAYEKLYEVDPEKAFKTLVGTLYALKDDQADQGFAISHMLRERHKTREDGFYLKFASDIAQDPKMSVMGRIVGFDAVMGSFDVPAKIITDTPYARDSLKTAIRYHQELPQAYRQNLEVLVKSAPDDWLEILQKEFENPLDSVILKVAEVTPSKTAKDMAAEALNESVNFRTIVAGVSLVAAQGDKRAIPLLNTLQTTHPISAVRYAAGQALKSLDGEEVEHIMPRLFSDHIKTVNQITDYCDIRSTNFRSIVKRMPHFGPQKFEGEPYAINQTMITSAFPLQNGWLVGYDKGEWGGALTYFDGLSNNKVQLIGSGYIPHYDSNIIAIIPIKTPKLGEFANDFWVVTGLNHLGLAQGSIYRIKGDGDKFIVKLHASLPSKPIKIEHKNDNSFVLDFRRPSHTTIENGREKINVLDQRQFNPPLRLLPNGALTRACQTGAANIVPSKKASP